MKYILLIFCTLLYVGSAQAKTFANSYVSFELPSNWSCKMEATEWVCKTSFTPKNKKLDAIIILTAKEVGPTDNLGAYQTYLKTPKVLSQGGKTSNSQIKNVSSRTINNQVWVDGLHLGSEAKNFYTRYLATTKNNIAILVTFSAHVKHYTKYSGQFIRAINSLRVLAKPGMLTGNGMRPTSSQPITTGPIGIGPIGPENIEEEFPEDNSGGGFFSSAKGKLLLVVLVVVGIGAYIITRKQS